MNKKMLLSDDMHPPYWLSSKEGTFQGACLSLIFDSGLLSSSYIPQKKLFPRKIDNTISLTYGILQKNNTVDKNSVVSDFITRMKIEAKDLAEQLTIFHEKYD